MKKILTIILCSLIISSNADAEDSCSSVEKLIAAHKDLRVLRGEKLDDETWQAKLKVLGFKDCKVQSHKGKLNYSCFERLKDKNQAVARMEKAGANLWNCDSISTRTLSDNKKWEIMSMNHFFATKDNISIQLNAGLDLFDGSSILQLSFYEN
ncbi:MAG: hypothetical protein WAW61_10425 [Methylococcaceae bacterium]